MSFHSLISQCWPTDYFLAKKTLNFNLTLAMHAAFRSFVGVVSVTNVVKKQVEKIFAFVTKLY